MPTYKELDFAKEAIRTLLTSLGTGNGRCFYSELTAAYEERTGIHVANEYPAAPLGIIQEACHELGLPCLSVLAINKTSMKPNMKGFMSCYRETFPENAHLSDKEVVRLEQKACRECPASEWQRLADRFGLADFAVPEPRDVVGEYDAKKYLEEGERILAELRTEIKRNPEDRAACLSKKGYTCRICGFNSEEAYGIPGIIHVHHKHPIADGIRHTDPMKDLVPLCPTCHALVHKKPGRNECYTVNEVREMLGKDPIDE